MLDNIPYYKSLFIALFTECLQCASLSFNHWECCWTQTEKSMPSWSCILMVRGDG